jgi:signal transduction histidine kinase
MNFRKITAQLNVFAQCRKYGISLWQCPQFLFLLMGLIIIASTLAAYVIGNLYVQDPQIVALIVIFFTAILFIIAVIITRSFERLAEASRMKSEFINIVTHQLRSPLTNLKWGIDFLILSTSKKSKEKQADYFKILKENTARMGELINNLLIVSRMEQGRLPKKETEISLEDLIKDLIEDFKPYALASQVEIKFKTQKNLPKILINPSQIKLVIENLLGNAIRYIKGKGKVEIQLLKKDNKFFFEIRDNGAGIPQKDQRHIFQKFFRGTNASKYQPQGTGLGLFIVKSIVENYGGKIDFKSEEGKGSTFWFTLPISPK